MKDRISVFRGGIPTQPDVKKLLDEFGIPKEGDLIPWDSIVEVIGAERKSNRFNAICTAWRNHLRRAHNVHMTAIIGKGLVAADPHERIYISSKWIKEAARKAMRSSALAETTDRQRLNEEDKKVADYCIIAPAKMRLAMVNEAKRLPKGT